MEGKEGFQLADIGLGILLTLCLISVVMATWFTFGSKASDTISEVESSDVEAPLIRLTELSMEHNPLLCTTVASVIKELYELDVAICVYSSDASIPATLYKQNDGVNIVYNGNAASPVVEVCESPSDTVSQLLLSHSYCRCVVTSYKSDSGYYIVDIKVVGG